MNPSLFRAWLLLITLSLTGISCPAQDQPVIVSENLPEPIRHDMLAQRTSLMQWQAGLKARIRAHNEKCGSVPTGSALEAECRKTLTILQSEVSEYSSAIRTFNANVARAQTSHPGSATESGSVAVKAKDDSLIDRTMVEAVFARADKELEEASQSLLWSSFLVEPTSRAAAKLHWERALDNFREAWASKQQQAHPTLIANMALIRKNPALAGELIVLLQRIRQKELEQLKNLDLERAQRTEDHWVAELDRLQAEGLFRDTADLIEKSKSDPLTRAALEKAAQRARTNMMRSQADILRFSIDEITSEVERLLQQAPVLSVTR
jgi:hypothetical protein